ncbi:MAG: hypothetical protein K0S32_1159 [Bacteroidetes bacterium]|nr:hypothetical protein [Bacteroidota bacterium]
MNYSKLILALFLQLFFSPFISKSQTCLPCTYTVTGVSNTSFTVNTGQTLCLDSLTKFSGTVTLNGGTVCNKGFFNPSALIFNSGTIYNYHNILLNNVFTLNTNCSLFNIKRSSLKITGTFAIAGGNFDNKGISSVLNPLSFNSGTFNNSGIINCKGLTGNTSGIVNTGIINKN